LRKQEGGAVFDEPGITVGAKEPGWEGRLELGEPTMLAELLEVRSESLEPATSDYPFLLISRRLREVYNSAGRDLPNFTRKATYNPAFMNPEDLSALGIASGAVVKIESSRGAIIGVAEAEAGLRRGVVSMAHAFGDAPDRDHDFREIGSTTGRLINNQRDFDPYSGIPRMSSIQVNVEAYDEAAAS